MRGSGSTSYVVGLGRVNPTAHATESVPERGCMLRCVVRPDERVGVSWEPSARSGCVLPTGASPVPVGVGAPGSRPQAGGEIPLSRAGRREPLRGEREFGSQLHVNPAASKEKQWGSRAAHVTAKATSSAPVPKRVEGSSGVRGATRSQGRVRNRRGPSSLPSSRRGVAYKPKAKSRVAERESEGIVVVRRPVKQNTVGAKGPRAGQVGT